MDNGVLKVALSTVIFEIGSLTAFNMDNDFRFNVTAPLFPLIRNNHRNVAPKARGVWGCAPVDRGGRFIGRLSTRKAGKCQLFLWRWAESNRRPNKAPDGFLRVYPAFDCRGPAARGRAIGHLASETWGAVEASTPASFLDDTPYTGRGRLESPAGYSSLRTWSARLS